MKKYARTKTELADALEITPQALYKNWIHREDFPAETAKGWNIAKCIEYKLGHDRRKDPQRGANSDLHRRKLEIEVALMEEKLASYRGENIPITEHHAEVAATVRISLDGWRFLRQDLAARWKDAALLEYFDEAADNARRQLMAAVEAGDYDCAEA